MDTALPRAGGARQGDEGHSLSPQPLRPAHPGQPGHRQPGGDPLEPLPLPAAGLGHRLPLYPQGCEVLGQGEAREARDLGAGPGLLEETGPGQRLRKGLASLGRGGVGVEMGTLLMTDQKPTAGSIHRFFKMTSLPCACHFGSAQQVC